MLVDDLNSYKRRLDIFLSRVALDNDGVLKEANDSYAILIPLVHERLGFGPLEAFRIELATEEDYWRGWSTNDSKGLLLRYNVHPWHYWRRGDLEYMTLHEVGSHFIQANNIMRAIRSHEMNDAIGLTTVQEPHTFVAEGVGETLSDFLPGLPLSEWAILTKELTYLRNLLNNNAHIRINNGASEAEVLDYVLTNHPFETEQRIKLNLQQWRYNPARRAYQYSYGIASFHHRRFADMLSDEGKLTYLRWALTGLSTPTQAFRKIAQITGQPYLA